MMKAKLKTRLPLVLSLWLLVSSAAFAQTASLFISFTGQSNPINLDETKQGVTVRNNGSIGSQPFQLRLWVSVDSTFNDNDQPVTLDQPFGLGVGSGATLEREFRFPLPEQTIDPTDRLFGDSRTPLQWIGETLFVQACISVLGGPFNRCQTVERVVIAPEAPGLGTTSIGTNASAFDLRWPVPTPYNGQSLVSHYQIIETRQDSAGGRRELTIPIADLDIVDALNGQARYRYFATGVERGVSYSYLIRVCSQVGAGVVCDSSARGFSFAFLAAEFSASDGTVTGGVEVNWREFSVSNVGYDIRRCPADDPSDCVPIAFNVQATNYLDSDVERGVDYIYEIFHCRGYIAGTTECNTFNSSQFSERRRTGVTNPGTPNLIDQYEVDDTPAQAKRVRSTVSQLRSFHTPDDPDWVEIILSKPQVLTIVTSGDTNNDTELVLYQADATTEISGDVGSGPGLYAQLTTEVLPAGRYYLKLYQRNLGIPALFKPVANYRLDIEITERQGVIAPIIDLLLNEG